jgi:NAD+ kinase
MLVKRDEDELLSVAVNTIEQLIQSGVQVLIDSYLWGKLENFYGDDDRNDDATIPIDLESSMIRLFAPKPVSGFGSGEQLIDLGYADSATVTSSDDVRSEVDVEERRPPADLSDADLIVTLGGDGLLMYAAQVFSGPVPPVLPVAGGSMGFLTPFAREEMLEAIFIALGLRDVVDDDADEEDLTDDDLSDGSDWLRISQRALNHMLIEATSRESYNEYSPLAFGNNKQICISMRMRLDCRIFGIDGSLLARYAVLNEVVIDRGSSPYLASLECFCDDVHLTTVQADGIIFSTPTGSTAYSMAAGGSVVHPAVPAILVTPICPHVLSFRSMVFPDHVVLRCYVPSDARSTACVYFDGKHRTELNRGDSVQIQMSPHPVPTINRADHSADWLSSLKRNFNFNTRVRQGPLS